MLEVQNLTMKFGGVTALDNISMHVHPNTIHGIIGPNGSGKTTMFNCISGIYKPTSGKILFNGKDITGLEPHKIASAGIARTFQLLRIFPSMTVLDNLILAQAPVRKNNDGGSNARRAAMPPRATRDARPRLRSSENSRFGEESV